MSVFIYIKKKLLTKYPNIHKKNKKMYKTKNIKNIYNKNLKKVNIKEENKNKKTIFIINNNIKT